MKNKRIQPYVIGRGMAGQAMCNSLLILGQKYPDLQILGPQTIERGTVPKPSTSSDTNSVLFIANPHGLHTQSILDAVESGFKVIVSDKPTCVSLEEVARLKSLPKDVIVNVCHGYRQAWAVQRLKKMIENDEFGDLINIQLRYWQSSVAAQAVSQQPPRSSWKNDSAISGKFDVLLDLGTHAVDLITYLMPEPQKTQTYLNYAHAQAPHRDSHVEIAMEYVGGATASASVSKIYHGATNDLSMAILGTKRSANWRFLNPDQIEIGEGAQTFYERRSSTEYGSGMPGFHALGWIEGYVDVIHQTLLQAANVSDVRPVPTLKEHLGVLEILFKSIVST